MKPTYIGLGPPRTGTTSIHMALTSHPEVDEVLSKEVHWFDHESWEATKKSIAKYESLWRDPGARARGEITPNYISYPDRVLSVYPDIKFFITWRDPVERVVSQLSLELGHAKKSMPLRDFPTFQQQFIERFEEQIAREDFWSYVPIKWGRKNIIKPWTDALSEDQLMIIDFKDLHDPETQKNTFNRLYKFLGVTPLGHLQRYRHSNSFPDVVISLSDETLAALRNYYNEYE